MIRKFCCVLLSLMLVCTCALADSTKTMLTAVGTSLTLTLKKGDTCDALAQESGSVVRTAVHRAGCADVTVSVAVYDLDGAQSLADLDASTLAAIKADILTDYPDGTITEHHTASGSLYLLVDAGNDYDLHDMFTIYQGFYIDLIQYKADFSALTDKDDAFLLDVMQGIWTK